jgi:Domain of unknown function (DUF4124)
MRSRAAVPWHVVAAVMALLVLPAAQGQTMYRCNSGGVMHLSDRPCDSGAQTVTKASGPASAPPSSGRGPAPSIPPPPDIRPFLSPACGQLNDAVRTGPARGLNEAAMSQLTDNYNWRCSADELQAHQKLQLSRSADAQQRQQAQTAQAIEQARARQTVEQCAEMLRSLSSRRQRAASMPAGERNDLVLFEANYKARCTGG